MLKKLIFWLECSRYYALPMSFFSWLIVFCYALQNSGNALYGILALIGICSAHLAANLFDDFFDFNNLKKITDSNNNITLPNTQRGKCKYLLDKEVKPSEVLSVVGLYCGLALLIGITFSFIIGKEVNIFIILGGLIVLAYPFCSNHRLSEIFVGTAFGPLLFGGVYYVMTSSINPKVFALSVPSMIFTINLLYTDTFLDKDIDKNEGKNTIVGLFKTDTAALKFQKWLIRLGYLSIFLIPIFDISDWQVFLSFLTIPLAIDLLDSQKMYSNDKTSIPEKKWYHFPFERWNDIKENRSLAFMTRMYQARNLMCYTSILISIAIVLYQ